MGIINVNNSTIYVCKNPRWVNDYNNYIVSLLKYVIKKHNLSINIILGHNACRYKIRGSNVFPKKQKTINININYEHTLVTDDKNTYSKHPKSNIIFNNSSYLIRIDKIEVLRNSHILLDYCIPNVYNVKTNSHYYNLSKNHIYIAPSLYENIFINHNNRKIDSLTTFLNVFGRRKRLLDNIRGSSLKHSNINTCFTKQNIQNLYKNTKILINIHQNDNTNSFEELRCLPALQNGVIIVSEESPLTNVLPYNDLIIWTKYDNIITKTKEVLNNYEEYYNKIFSKNNINILKNIDSNNKKDIETKILDRIKVVS